VLALFYLCVFSYQNIFYTENKKDNSLLVKFKSIFDDESINNLDYLLVPLEAFVQGNHTTRKLIMRFITTARFIKYIRCIYKTPIYINISII
jgi:hypothetical protein